MGFVGKWGPLVVVLLLVVLAWYVVFIIGLEPAYSRDALGVSLTLEPDH